MTKSITLVKDFSGTYIREEMPRKIPARNSSFCAMVEKFYGSGDKMNQNISKLNSILNFMTWKNVPQSFRNSRAIKLRSASMENAISNSNLINSTFTFSDSELDNVITGTNDLVIESYEETTDEKESSKELNNGVESITFSEDESSSELNETPYNSGEELSSMTVSDIQLENKDVYDAQTISLDTNDEQDDISIRLPRGGNAARIYDDDSQVEHEKSKDVDKITIPRFPSFSEMFVPVDVNFNYNNNEELKIDREMPIVVDDVSSIRKIHDEYSTDMVTFNEDLVDSDFLVPRVSDNRDNLISQQKTKELLLSIQEKLEKLNTITKMAGDAKKTLIEQEKARKQSDEILKDKTRAIIEMSHLLDGDIAAVTEETRKYEISIDEQKKLLEQNNQVIDQIDSIIESGRSVSRR